MAVNGEESSSPARLHYVSDSEPGIRRERRGKGFSYRLPDGGLLRDREALRRIASLAIPPAYTDVWICLDPYGHIQATGRDQRGRKQYRYHPLWLQSSSTTKFERMVAFAHALPALRARVADAMAAPGLGREKVLATVVHLLETTLIRMGSEEYARQNDSYGLTTLRPQHVSVTGAELRFWFEGKSGKTWRVRVKDRRVARVIRRCQELPGQMLFQYLDEDGEPGRITSADVNGHLREITGEEITAKDFRTWAGTVMTAAALREAGPAPSAAEAKKVLKAVIGVAAARLGNTPTVCRASYVHPMVIDSYLDASLFALAEEKRARADLAGLSRDETLTLALLEKASRPSQDIIIARPASDDTPDHPTA